MLKRILLSVLLVFILAGCTPEAAESWRPFWDAVAESIQVTPIAEVPEWDKDRTTPVPDDVVDEPVVDPLPEVMPDPCLMIKLNINSRGVRIYHVPGGAYYDQVRIVAEKGERFACSEAEAVELGWRKAAR